METQNQALDTPVSIADAGYKIAKNDDAVRSIARWLLSQDKSLAEGMTKEVKEELYTGFRLKWSHDNPAVDCIVVGGNILKASDVVEVPKNAERLSIGMEAVYNYGQQAFGKLKDSQDPLDRAKHAFMTPIRKKVSDYCTDKIRKTEKAIRDLANEGKPKTKASTDDFAVYLEKTLKTIATRLKTSIGRDDETADAKKFERARIAFLKEWNK